MSKNRTAPDPLAEPTDEFAMRHAANGLIDLVNSAPSLSQDALKAIDYAYKQLHRGANTLHDAEVQAWTTNRMERVNGLLEGLRREIGATDASN